ncbi:hypothetical protein AtEden1_Chr00c003g0324131 [Arabidopsis thaliana]
MESREVDEDDIVVYTPHRSIIVGLRSLRWAPLGDESVVVPDPRHNGSTLCTRKRLTHLIDQSIFPDGLTVMVPEKHQRPWKPPQGFFCMYEVGLMMLGADCGVEVDADLLEEATTFAAPKDNPGLCQVNARPNHKLVKGMKSKVPDWRRYFFFMELSEISVSDLDLLFICEWNMFPAHDFQPRGTFGGIYASLAAVRTRKPLHWPDVINSFETHSPSTSEMGKASLATDVDVPAVVTEPQQVVAKVLESGEIETNQQITNEDRATQLSDARVGKKAWGSDSEDRAMRLLDARAGKIASNSVSEDGAIFREPLSVHASPRSKVSRGGSSRDSFPVVRERGSTQDIREVDHSFSFNYDRKGYPFSDSRSYCGEFARKVNGSSRENPPVESPITKNLYQTWACKEVQRERQGRKQWPLRQNERSLNLLQQLVCVT